MHPEIKNCHNPQNSKMSPSGALVIYKMKMKTWDIYSFHIFRKPETYDRTPGIV